MATIAGANGLDIRLFGAVGNGIADDTAAIQAAINQAIAWSVAGLGTFEVLIPPGQYLTSAPLYVMSFNGTTYSYFSLTIRGHSEGYILGEKTAILPNFKTLPAVVVQTARNIKFEGFSIVGNANTSLPANYLLLLNDAASPWWNTGGARDNTNSPHCGIAVDPFNSGIASGNQYPGLSANYVAAAGSSRMFLQNMEMNRFIVGLGLSLAGQVNNDRITLDACDFSQCKVGVSIGNAQNRGIILRSCASTGNQVLVDNVRYGNGQGAGFVVEGGTFEYQKALIFGNGGVGSAIFRDIYVEAIWMIGVWLGAFPFTIDSCTIKLLYAPFWGYPAPDFHLNIINCVTSIRGGYIGFYSNLYARASFLNTNGQVTFDGVQLDGECCFFNPNQTAHNHCTLDAAQAGYYGLSREFTLPLATLGGLSGSAVAQVQIDQGGTIYDPTTGYTWKSLTGWETISLGGSIVVTANGDGTGSFTSATAALQLRPPTGSAFNGDYVQCNGSWQSNDTLAPANTFCNNLAIGQVSSISGSTVNLYGMPLSFVSGTYSLTITRLPTIRQPAVGTTTSGSTSVTGVTPTTAGNAIWNPYPVTGLTFVGDRIKGAGIPAGTWVTAVGAGTLTLSRAATASATVDLYDANIELLDASGAAAPSAGTWRQSMFVKNTAPVVDGNNNVLLGWMCTASGSPGTWTTIYGKATSP